MEQEQQDMERRDSITCPDVIIIPGTHDILQNNKSYLTRPVSSQSTSRYRTIDPNQSLSKEKPKELMSNVQNETNIANKLSTKEFRFGQTLSVPRKTHESKMHNARPTTAQRRSSYEAKQIDTETTTHTTTNTKDLRRIQESKTDSFPISTESPQVTREIQKCKKVLAKIAVLWDKLKIPKVDREIFWEKYCASSKLLLDSKKILGEHLEILQFHDTHSEAVIDSIQHRERLLSILHDRTSGGPAFSQKAKASERRQLMQLRDASLRVIENIIQWRKLQWERNPYCWSGHNYLIKMRFDARQIGITVDPRCKDYILFNDCAIIDPLPNQSKVASLISYMNNESQNKSQDHDYIPFLRWTAADLATAAFVPEPTIKEEFSNSDIDIVIPNIPYVEDNMM